MSDPLPQGNEIQLLQIIAAGVQAITNGATGDANAVHYNAADGKSAGEQAQARANIGALKFGVQYLIANAVWDGSAFVTTDSGGAYTLDTSGQPGAYFMVGYSGAYTLSISGIGISGSIPPDKFFWAYENATHDDGAIGTITTVT
jgi:hypothetical protein